jgi:hypothetical protein
MFLSETLIALMQRPEEERMDGSLLLINPIVLIKDNESEQ